MNDNKVELHDIDSERNVIRRLCTDESYSQRVALNQLIVVEHFSDLFHRDAFITLIDYYKSFGVLPDLKKFSSHLEKFVTSADNFQNKEQQIGIWKASAEKLFKPLSEDEKKSTKADTATLENYRKGRLFQQSITTQFELFNQNKFNEGFKAMSSTLLASRIDDNRILEGDVVHDWLQHKQYMDLQRSGLIKPIPCGMFGAMEDEAGNGTIVYIDDLLYGGWYPSDLVIVIGETSIGKSFFLMETAFFASYKGHNAIYFTIEMDKMKAQRRIYSRMSGIQYKLFRTAEISERQESIVQNRLNAWEKQCGKLYVVSFDTGATVQDIEAKMNETQNRFGIEWDLCVIDYLNDMTPVGRHSSAKAWEGMGEISWGLAQLAKNFNAHKGLPIVTANQKRGDKAGSSKTNWSDAAFAKMVMHHASIGMGLGANQDDKDAGRIMFNQFKHREGDSNISMYIYPNLAVSRLTSLKRLRDYYGMDD